MNTHPLTNDLLWESYIKRMANRALLTSFMALAACSSTLVGEEKKENGPNSNEESLKAIETPDVKKADPVPEATTSSETEHFRLSLNPIKGGLIGLETKLSEIEYQDPTTESRGSTDALPLASHGLRLRVGPAVELSRPFTLSAGTFAGAGVTSVTDTVKDSPYGDGTFQGSGLFFGGRYQPSKSTMLSLEFRQRSWLGGYTAPDEEGELEQHQLSGEAVEAQIRLSLEF